MTGNTHGRIPFSVGVVILYPLGLAWHVYFYRDLMSDRGSPSPFSIADAAQLLAIAVVLSVLGYACLRRVTQDRLSQRIVTVFGLALVVLPFMGILACPLVGLYIIFDLRRTSKASINPVQPTAGRSASSGV